MSSFEKIMIYMHLSITLIGAYSIHFNEKHISKKHKTIQIDSLNRQ
jgi:hypothetical protein